MMHTWCHMVGDGVYLNHKESPEVDWYYGVIICIKEDGIVEVVTDKRTTVTIKTEYLIPRYTQHFFEK